jgi:hypothetical protein
MATRFQLLVKLQRRLEDLKTVITLARQERYIMDEYHQEAYVWYDLEVGCDDWYMDSCHFWDDDHFHILFDDSTIPHVEPILESTQESSLHILLQFYYSSVVVDEFLVGSTYFDPHDQCRSLEHHFQLTMVF